MESGDSDEETIEYSIEIVESSSPSLVSSVAGNLSHSSSLSSLNQEQLPQQEQENTNQQQEITNQLQENTNQQQSNKDVELHQETSEELSPQCQTSNNALEPVDSSDLNRSIKTQTPDQVQKEEKTINSENRSVEGPSESPVSTDRETFELIITDQELLSTNQNCDAPVLINEPPVAEEESFVDLNQEETEAENIIEILRIISGEEEEQAENGAAILGGENSGVELELTPQLQAGNDDETTQMNLHEGSTTAKECQPAEIEKDESQIPYIINRVANNSNSTLIQKSDLDGDRMSNQTERPDIVSSDLTISSNQPEPRMVQSVENSIGENDEVNKTQIENPPNPTKDAGYDAESEQIKASTIPTEDEPLQSCIINQELESGKPDEVLRKVIKEDNEEEEVRLTSEGATSTTSQLQGSEDLTEVKRVELETLAESKDVDSEKSDSSDVFEDTLESQTLEQIEQVNALGQSHSQNNQANEPLEAIERVKEANSDDESQMPDVNLSQKLDSEKAEQATEQIEPIVAAATTEAAVKDEKEEPHLKQVVQMKQQQQHESDEQERTELIVEPTFRSPQLSKPEVDHNSGVELIGGGGGGGGGGEEEDLEFEFDNEPEFERRQIEVKLEIDPRSEYSLHDELGRGKFGTVYRCIEQASGRKFAAKFVHMRRKEDREDVKREIEIMSLLQHKRLLQLYDAFDDGKNEMCLITELVDGGELFERIVDDDFELTERKAAIFMRQICEGMEYMHSQNIIHLDMKPENILCVSRTGNRIKLIDFGLARKLEISVDGPPLRVMFGTPDFAAPEVLAYDVVSLATDMWSVGVICYVLLSGLSPFMGDSDMDTMANVTRATFDFDDPAFDPISDLAKDFISKLLVKEQTKRLTPNQCLAHPWLQRGGAQLEASVRERRNSMAPSLLLMPNQAATTELPSPANHLSDIEQLVVSCESPPSLDKRNLKRYVIRRRWHKTVHAIMALQRMGANLKI